MKRNETNRRLRTMLQAFCCAGLFAVILTGGALAEEPAGETSDVLVNVSAGVDGIKRDLLGEPHRALSEFGWDDSALDNQIQDTVGAAVGSAAGSAFTQVSSSVKGIQDFLGSNEGVNDAMHTISSAPRSALDAGYDYVLKQTKDQVGSTSRAGQPIRVYTSIGDSVQSGCGLEEYFTYGRFVVANKNIAGSAPMLIGDATGATVHQLHVPGARAGEIRYILDDDYDGDWITDGQSYYLSDGELGRENLDSWKDEYRRAVQEADVVALDVSFNDYWVPWYGAMYDVAQDGRLPWDDWTPWGRIRCIGPMGALADTLASVGRAYALQPLKAWKYDLKFADSVGKFFVDYPVNLKATADSIYRLNPDATLLLFVGYNPMQDWDLVPAWDDNLVGDLLGVIFAAHDIAKVWVAVTYPGDAVLVDARGIDVITDQTMLFVFERMSIDDSGFNPHPTVQGSRQLAGKALDALGQDNPYVAVS